MRDDQGKWRIRRAETYRDGDGKVFSFPPPNSSVQQFIDEESLSSGNLRGEYDNSLPGWVRILARMQKDAGGSAVLFPPPSSAAARRNGGGTGVSRHPAVRVREIAPPQRRIRKRGSLKSEEITSLKEQGRVLQAQLDSAPQHIEGMNATIEMKDREMFRIRIERDQQRKEVSRLK